MRSVLEHAQRVQAALVAERAAEAAQAAARRAEKAKAEAAALEAVRAEIRARAARSQAKAEGRLKSCLECREEFCLSPGEILFFSSRDLAIPKRCAACRAARRARGELPRMVALHQWRVRRMGEGDHAALDLERALARGDDL